MQRILHLLALAAMLSAGALYGQITGDLRGTVLDGSGGAVTSSKVTLTNLETGESRTTTVNSDGGFNFALLRIGSYEVRAEAPGFRVSTARGEVKTGEVTSVRFVLEVGSVKIGRAHV